jgi:hypothetical protein
MSDGSRSTHGDAEQPKPVTSLNDPRALQILSTEHWSLLSARALAYNEAFTRGGMFLTFLSMSFVALALVSQTMPLGSELLVVAAIVLALDLVLGLTTYGRIIAANHEDFRALHGMARIRHGYTQIAPTVLPYLTTSIHDDVAGVMANYRSGPPNLISNLAYGLTTSGGMIGLIVSVLGGVLAMVIALLLGATSIVAFGAAAAVGLLIFVGLIWLTARFFTMRESGIEALFPSPVGEGETAGPREGAG